MAEVVLVYGKSGAGKSRSLKNFAEDEIFYVNVTDKRLPFAHGFKWTSRTSDVDKILEGIKKMPCKVAVVDDAGYIMTNMFMAGHGKGDQFKLYNDIADSMWKLILGIKSMPDTADKVVYLTFHEDKGEQGDSKLLTIGKLLDQKVCIEGMFTIVLRAVHDSTGYAFITQSADMAVSKSPMGMFESERIDNDFLLVEKAVREFYEIPVNNKEAKKNAET